MNPYHQQMADTFDYLASQTNLTVTFFKKWLVDLSTLAGKKKQF